MIRCGDCKRIDDDGKCEYMDLWTDIYGHTHCRGFVEKEDEEQYIDDDYILIDKILDYLEKVQEENRPLPSDVGTVRLKKEYACKVLQAVEKFVKELDE